MVDSPGRRGDQRRARAASVAPLTAMPETACLSAGAVIDAVAGHRDDVADRLKRFDDLIFVLREHSAETVGALHRFDDAARQCVGLRAAFEDVACDEQMRAHAELGGDLVADGDVIASHHLDVEAEACAPWRSSPWRRRAADIHQRNQSDERPFGAVFRHCDAERALTLGGERPPVIVIVLQRLRSSAWDEGGDRLRRAFRVMTDPAGAVGDRGDRAFADGMDRTA